MHFASLSHKKSRCELSSVHLALSTFLPTMYDTFKLHLNSHELSVEICEIINRNVGPAIAVVDKI